MCNFLLLSLAAKGKKVPCVISSSCPWQQKVNSKQGRAGAKARQCRGKGKGRAGQGRSRAGQGRAGRPGQ